MDGAIAISPSLFVTDLNVLPRVVVVVVVVVAISSEWEKNQVRTPISGDQFDRCCLLTSLVDSALSPFWIQFQFNFFLSFFLYYAALYFFKKKKDIAAVLLGISHRV